MTTNRALGRKGTHERCNEEPHRRPREGRRSVGDITFWMLAEASIDRQSLESKWKAAQLPMALLPEPPTIVKSFKLAVKETQTGLTDRLIRVAVDDEASVVFAIVHEARHADGTLVYTQEAKVRPCCFAFRPTTDMPGRRQDASCVVQPR